MEEKLKEVKVALLDRILSNIKDETKSLNIETIVSFAGIVETFDKTEELKKQPKSDPDLYVKSLLQVIEKSKEAIEQPKVALPITETL